LRGAPRVGATSEAEGHLVGWSLGVFFTIVLAQEFVGFGEEGGVVMLGHVFDPGGDLREGVAEVLELVVELLVIVAEPLLKTLEKVAREVPVVVGGVAVLADLAQLVHEDFLVVFCGGFEGVPVEPCRGPGEGVEEHGFIAVVLGFIVFVKLGSDVSEHRIQIIVSVGFVRAAAQVGTRVPHPFGASPSTLFVLGTKGVKRRI
jgi:hypothetical protein